MPVLELLQELLVGRGECLGTEWLDLPVAGLVLVNSILNLLKL